MRCWLKSTVFFYAMICLAAGLLSQLLPHIFLENIIAEMDFKQFSSLTGLLSEQIYYFADVLTFYSFLSGMLLYVGVNAALPVCTRYFDERNPAVIPSHEPVIKRRAILCISIALISGIIFYTGLQSSGNEFNKRNLGQILGQLWASNPIFRVTEARNDLVYLLEVHMVDSDTKKPLANIGVNIVKNKSQGACLQSSSILTDSDGAAVFMLEKGQYMLTLDSYNVFAGFDNMKPYSCQFEMLTPGKSELDVELCRKNTGLPYLAYASLQFIP